MKNDTSRNAKLLEISRANQVRGVFVQYKWRIFRCPILE
jgi:hypothetical protein